MVLNFFAVPMARILHFVCPQFPNSLLWVSSPTLLTMGRYYNTTMRHYWDMLVK